IRHDVTTIAEVNALALDEDQRENGAIVLYDGITCYWSINWATRNERPGRWYDNSGDGLRLVDGDEVAVLVPIEAEEEFGAGGDGMDGGVTAALIEKEAEESPSVDYETMWWEAERRAEKAEAERDRWHSMWRQRRIKQLAAEKRATRAEAERVREAKAEAWDECEATAIIEDAPCS